MKKVVIVPLAFVVILFSCKSGGSNFKHSKSDTIKSWAIYDLQQQGVRSTDVYTISHDSMYFVDKDSTTKVKKWARAKDYFVPQVDTVKVAGVIQLDTLGKPKLTTNYYPIPPSWVVRDMNINIDSLQKEWVKKYTPAH